MAKKNINPRCPLSGECERKQCEHINHELDCEYYEANGWGDNSIPDQDALREQEERKLDEERCEAELSGLSDEGAGRLVSIPVDRLHPHPGNPRKDLGDLSELADSIKENGIFQNLTVVPDGDGYTVIIGHRRLAAAKLAGLIYVPCVITIMTEKEQMQTMLMENMQRSDLTVYEQAHGFQMMLDLGSTVEEIAEKSGFSTTTVKRRVKMMELDQDKLKEASSRQISLGDFDTLAQIENIKERNKVLESIGTRDFDANVSRALSKQAEQKNRPLVKAWLKEIGAKEIKSSDAWSNKYETYPGCSYYIYLAKWGEEGNKPPKTLKDQVYYVLDSSSLRLYKKREKAKPEKKSATELAKEKAVREAWKSLDDTAVLAHDLRKQFVEKLTVTRISKNKTDILYGALMAHLLEAIDYNSPDRTAICKVFNIRTDTYDSKRGEKLVAGIGSVQDKDLPALVYAGFGDDEKQMCCGTGYRGDFPGYEAKPKIAMIYAWLERLGYEKSTEEIQLLNGEHPGYHAAQAYKEATQK